MGKFKKAVREKLKLRAAIDGPAGTGKTMTGLRWAMALAQHYGGRVAVVETENSSTRKYLNLAPDQIPFDFDILELSSYSPTEYTAAIEEAGRQGYTALLIDSLSHAWQGKDGALELVNKNPSKNSFTAWKDVTPMHTRMIEAILQSPCHVIATMRSKTEYVLEPNDKGKMEPRKVGLAPIQRAGMEYEFDLYMSMDWSHVGHVSKSRCTAVADAVVVKPGAAFLQNVIAWLDTGDVAAPAAAAVARRASDGQITEIMGRFEAAGLTLEKLRQDLSKRFSVTEVADLRPDQAQEMVSRLDALAKSKVSRDGSKNGKASTVEPACPAAPPAPVASSPASAAAVESNGHDSGPQKTHLSSTTAERAAGLVNGKANAAQLERLKQYRIRLFNQMGIIDDFPACEAAWSKILKKRNVASARNLSEEQADQLLISLSTQLGDDEPTPFDGAPIPEAEPPKQIEAAEQAAIAAATTVTP